MITRTNLHSNFLFILIGFAFLVATQFASADPQTVLDQQNTGENCKSVELNYSMENGRILNMCHDRNAGSLTVQIEADSEDQITMDIPKRLVYSIELDCEESKIPMIILMDGDEIEPTIISSKTTNKVTIDVQKGIHQMEFIGAFPIPDPSPSMYCGIVMGYDTQYLPPKWQLELGVKPEMIRCNQGLELAIKTSDENPICITQSTKSKLVERNWAKEK